MVQNLNPNPNPNPNPKKVRGLRITVMISICHHTKPDDIVSFLLCKRSPRSPNWHVVRADKGVITFVLTTPAGAKPPGMSEVYKYTPAFESLKSYRRKHISSRSMLGLLFSSLL